MAIPEHPAAAAYLRDAIPLVAGTAERFARFGARPDDYQRCQRVDTGCIEVFDPTLNGGAGAWRVLGNLVTGG